MRIIVTDIDSASTHPRLAFPTANGIRGLAVLIVLVAHSTGMFFPKIGSLIPGTGKIGVWLFFALSALLLTSNFINNGFGINQIISYFLGRFLRIIPLYVIAVIVYYSLDYYPIDFAYLLLKLNSPWGHLWTVAVEFKFYFILPIIVFILSKFHNKFGRLGLYVISMVIIITHQYFYPYSSVSSSSTNMTDYISAFVPGIVVSFLIRDGLTSKSWVATSGILVIIIGVIFSIPGVRMYFLGIPVDNYLLDKHLHFGLAWAALIYFSLSSQTIFNKILTIKPLTYLGRWSFSIYLFHWLVYTQLLINHKESLAYSIMAPFLAILLGWIVYSLIEKPIEKSRHKLMAKLILSK